MMGDVRPSSSPLEIIRAGTRFGPVPLVPEISLYQAAEPMGLWQRTELAAGQTGLDPPFWAFAWAGGQALARYLLDHREVVAGRRVIDVASGSGLVAIAAAWAGADTVTAYDIDPLAVAAITLNAAANGVAVTAVCADILDSGTPDSGIPDSGTPDSGGTPALDAVLMLAADAFYQRDLAGRVTRFLERGRARGAAVLAGDFGRAYLPRDRLVSLATYDVPGLGAVEDSDIKRTTIWTLAQMADIDG
ncbi:MAG: 50S ribosomal protein L11 methyltransferase [Streptosporangiaceae bacterium]